MNKSGKKSGGYVKKDKRPMKLAVEPQLRASKENAEETKWREAQETMFAVIRELLEAQQRAHHAGKTGVDSHATAMRKLLRYVRRKVEETVVMNAEVGRSSRRK